MRVALITVYSHRECTLKDVAGGYGTVFQIGDSRRARWLSHAKSMVARLPSTTLGYLARLAHDAGHDVSVHEVQRGDAGHTRLPAADLAIVLTSIVDATAERDVLRELRRSGVRTLACGAFATARPAFFEADADAVILGEPENLGPALFDPSLRGHVNAGYAADLDTLPFPHWDPFPIETYRYAFLTGRGATLPVAGARGCAFGCGYCPFRATSPFRERNPDAVVREIAGLVHRYGTRGIAFRDPLFNLHGDRARAIAKGLAPLGVRWSAEMRADRLDEGLLADLHRGGLRSLEIGVESVNLEMLKKEHRHPPSRAQIESVVTAARRLGIRVIANFMMGLPGDTEEAIRESVAWAKQLRTFAVQFTVATPYPGTTLEAQTADPTRPKSLPLLAPDRLTGWEPVFTHPTLSAERIRALREWAYVSFHYRPTHVAAVAKHAVRSLIENVVDRRPAPQGDLIAPGVRLGSRPAGNRAPLYPHSSP